MLESREKALFEKCNAQTESSEREGNWESVWEWGRVTVIEKTKRVIKYEP